jgi:hypothetical protein
MKKPFQTVALQDCSDERGSMKVLSCGRELPFEAKRVFFSFDSACASVRGNHAHVYSREAFVCLQGSAEMTVDDGRKTYALTLHDPGELLIVEPMTWIKLEHYSADCIMLVLSDSLYSQADNIGDYDAFLKKSSETQGLPNE